ncbi:MAG: matrixin family metalloprotease [Gaiellaceae bacterium]
MPPFAFAAGLAQGANVLRETGNRVVGIPELAGSLAGSRRPKKLRVRVVILRDEAGKPVATPEEVEPSLVEARRVLRELLAIDLLPAAEPLVWTLEIPAPPSALDSPCAEGSYRADFGEGGAFFRRHRKRGGVTGSGAPITVFVVRDVLGKAGCSLGPLVDHVTVDMTALKGRRRRVLAHELGHACGLPHSNAAENLMLPKAMGDRLQPWQIAVFRSSRHVTYR